MVFFISTTLSASNLTSREKIFPLDDAFFWQQAPLPKNMIKIQEVRHGFNQKPLALLHPVNKPELSVWEIDGENSQQLFGTNAGFQCLQDKGDTIEFLELGKDSILQRCEFDFKTNMKTSQPLEKPFVRVFSLKYDFSSYCGETLDESKENLIVWVKSTNDNQWHEFHTYPLTSLYYCFSSTFVHQNTLFHLVGSEKGPLIKSIDLNNPSDIQTVDKKIEFPCAFEGGLANLCSPELSHTFTFKDGAQYFEGTEEVQTFLNSTLQSVKESIEDEKLEISNYYVGSFSPPMEYGGGYMTLSFTDKLSLYLSIQQDQESYKISGSLRDYISPSYEVWSQSYSGKEYCEEKGSVPYYFPRSL